MPTMPHTESVQFSRNILLIVARGTVDKCYSTAFTPAFYAEVCASIRALREIIGCIRRHKNAGNNAAQNSRFEHPDRWSVEPSEQEVLLIALFGFVMFVAVILKATNFSHLVNNFGDSPAYMSIASAIRRWNFQGMTVKQFWGLPYMMAALSMLTRMSERSALLAISVISSFLTVLLAYRLWGGWVASFFGVLNFDWLQRSLLGGSEPLFMVFLLGAFVAVRRQRWLLATFLASLATVVRPLGLFALVGIGIALLRLKQFHRFICALGIGLAVATAYAVPLAYEFGDPLATVHSYQQIGASTPNLFGVPFYAIIKGTFTYPAPWTNLVLTFGWILFVVAGTIRMGRVRNLREYAKNHLVEMMFAAAYLVAICCYNFPYWARGNFPRFAIPLIPFVLVAFDQWWPKDRRLLWGLATVSPILAAISALGLRNVLHRLTA